MRKVLLLWGYSKAEHIESFKGSLVDGVSNSLLNSSSLYVLRVRRFYTFFS